MKFRIGIIGAGYVSSHHLRALRTVESVSPVVLADIDQKRAESIAGQFQIPRVVNGISDLEPGEVDVVHILTPPSSHCSITLEALKKGFHVFVEKPMAETEEDCRRMIDAAHRAGRVLSVNHSARMDPIILKGIEAVRSNVCGEVTGVDFFRSSDYPPYWGGPVLPPPYRTGAYPFQDLGVHGISICESFLGPALCASVKYWHRGADFNLMFDEWRAVIECEHGVGQLFLSWNNRPIRSEVFVHGTRGSLHIDCFLQTCHVSKTLPGPKFLSNVMNGIRSSVQSLWQIPWNVARFATGRLPGAPGIHNSIAHFYEALSRDGQIPIPSEEGRRVVAVMEPSVGQANCEYNRHRQERLKRHAPADALITGASGFVGARLVRKLVAQGKKVRVLVRQSLPEWTDNPLIDVCLADLGDSEVVNRAVEEVDLIFHVGAAMRGDAAAFQRGTVWGTRNIVEACLRHGVRRLVYISSISVLDHAGRRDRVAVNEVANLEPHPEKRGLYTQTKLQAEQIVRTAMEREGLDAVILRPGQIFGPGSERVPPPGVIAFGKIWVVVGNGELNLPLVYVDDVIDAIMLAAHTSATGIYNVVDTSAITQRTYLDMIHRLSDGSTSVHYCPKPLLLTLGCACEVLQRITGRSLPLSRYRIHSIRPLYPFDVTASKVELQWTPTIGSALGLKMMEETGNCLSR